jgi:hypothetical protein
MRITRGLAALSVATVAVLGLSACSSDSSGSGSDRTASAGQSTEQTEEVVEDAGYTVDDFVSRITRAAVEAGSVTTTMSTTTSGITMNMTSDVVFTGTSQNMRATVDMQGTALDMVVVDGIVYMSMGELTGGKFIKVDPSDPNDPMASSFAGLDSQLDPTASIKTLDGAIVSVDKSGDPVELDGVQAQPYTVVVDTAKMNNPAMSEVPAGTLPAQISYTYWVGEDDLMRKVAMEMDGTTLEMLMTGWGTPLEILAPSADQITDMTF